MAELRRCPSVGNAGYFPEASSCWCASQRDLFDIKWLSIAAEPAGRCDECSVLQVAAINCVERCGLIGQRERAPKQARRQRPLDQKRPEAVARPDDRSQIAIQTVGEGTGPRDVTGNSESSRSRKVEMLSACCSRLSHLAPILARRYIDRLVRRNDKHSATRPLRGSRRRRRDSAEDDQECQGSRAHRRLINPCPADRERTAAIVSVPVRFLPLFEATLTVYRAVATARMLQR